MWPNSHDFLIYNSAQSTPPSFLSLGSCSQCLPRLCLVHPSSFSLLPTTNMRNHNQRNSAHPPRALHGPSVWIAVEYLHMEWRSPSERRAPGFYAYLKQRASASLFPSNSEGGISLACISAQKNTFRVQIIWLFRSLSWDKMICMLKFLQWKPWVICLDLNSCTLGIWLD